MILNVYQESTRSDELRSCFWKGTAEMRCFIGNRVLFVSFPLCLGIQWHVLTKQSINSSCHQYHTLPFEKVCSSVGCHLLIFFQAQVDSLLNASLALLIFLTQWLIRTSVRIVTSLLNFVGATQIALPTLLV